MSIEELIEQLKNLEACAYGYHINGEVLGMDCSDFEQLMVDAAEEISRISTLQAENEKLRAELEWKDKVIQLAQREERKAKAELEQVKADRSRYRQIAEVQDRRIDEFEAALTQARAELAVIRRYQIAGCAAGLRGPVPECPRCGSHVVEWDAETDTCKCRDCGWSSG